MTFNEALEFKRQCGEFVTENKIKYTVMVVPEKEKDFEKYCANYLYNNSTDETAISFSSNSKYQVYGLNISHGIFIVKMKLS